MEIEAKDIFDTEPKPKKEKQDRSWLTKKPVSLAKPKNDPEELRRARRAAKKALREEQSDVIVVLVAAGIPDKTIARMLKMDIRSLRKNFSAELEDGGFEATGRVAQTVFNAAVNGHLASAMFWLKTKGGFKESAELDVSVSTGRELSGVERSQRMLSLFMSNPQFREMVNQKQLAAASQPAIDITPTPTKGEENEEDEEDEEDEEENRIGD